MFLQIPFFNARCVTGVSATPPRLKGIETIYTIHSLTKRNVDIEKIAAAAAVRRRVLR